MKKQHIPKVWKFQREAADANHRKYEAQQQRLRAAHLLISLNKGATK